MDHRIFTGGIALALGATVMTLPALAAQSVDVDSVIVAEMERSNFPGLAAAAFDSGRVVWVGTYGLSNVEDDEPVTEQTSFHLASVSKPVTATVLLSLHADGRFGLDDDINDYLPFEVRNPNHPSIPITFRSCSVTVRA